MAMNQEVKAHRTANIVALFDQLNALAPGQYSREPETTNWITGPESGIGMEFFYHSMGPFLGVTPQKLTLLLPNERKRTFPFKDGKVNVKAIHKAVAEHVRLWTSIRADRQDAKREAAEKVKRMNERARQLGERLTNAEFEVIRTDMGRSGEIFVFAKFPGLAEELCFNCTTETVTVNLTFSCSPENLVWMARKLRDLLLSQGNLAPTLAPHDGKVVVG